MAERKNALKRESDLERGAAAHSGVGNYGSSEPIARRAHEILVDQRALDPLLLDVSVHSGFCDYFIIGSGTSTTHVQGICSKVEALLEPLRQHPPTITGYETGEWIAMDYGDFVVHVFYEPLRHFYDIEGLWKETSECVPATAELSGAVEKLRTGMIRLS